MRTCLLPDVAEEKVYYRYEGPNSQRHLEESRTGRESSQLTVASRLDLARGEAGAEGRWRAKMKKRTRRAHSQTSSAVRSWELGREAHS